MSHWAEDEADRMEADLNHVDEMEAELRRLRARERLLEAKNAELETQVEVLANQKAELDEETLWLTAEYVRLKTVFEQIEALIDKHDAEPPDDPPHTP